MSEPDQETRKMCGRCRQRPRFWMRTGDCHGYCKECNTAYGRESQRRYRADGQAWRRLQRNRKQIEDVLVMRLSPEECTELLQLIGFVSIENPNDCDAPVIPVECD